MANVTLTQDQGIGNGSEYRSSAFGVVFPDYDESTRAQSDTGICLYFSRMIVEYHNGDIKAHGEFLTALASQCTSSLNRYPSSKK